jgi:hypothetical protein
MNKKGVVIGVSATTISAAVVILAALGGQVLGADTSVNVNVPAGIRHIGDTFIITIGCSPTRPVKAWELKVNFNKNVLSANSVTEGNFFAGKTTFFNGGTIQNSNGKIINIYDLIVGPGNVTAAGNLVTISFTAIGYGLSAIEIYNVGLTNETMYIPIIITNSSVVIYSPYDMNDDGTINMLDLVNAAGHYGEIGAAGWIRQDINKDGKVSVMDLVLISTHWG